MISQKGMAFAPVLVPIRIKTLGLAWYKQIWAALGARKYKLAEDWYFVDSQGNTCIIPSAYMGSKRHILSMGKVYYFESDGTSWPRVFQFLFDNMGLGLTAGLAHDFGTRYRCFLDPEGQIVRVFNTRKEIDDEFYFIDRRVNDMPWLSMIKWIGARLGSWISWNRCLKMPEEQRDAKRLL